MNIDIITLFIKMLITNNCIYYACNKIVNMNVNDLMQRSDSNEVSIR